MSIAKIVVPCFIALSLVACATPGTKDSEQVLAVCGEAEVSVGTIIAKRDKCHDKTADASGAAREKAASMREEQNRLKNAAAYGSNGKIGM